MANRSTRVIDGLLLVLLLASTSVSALSIQWMSLPETATRQGNPGTILGNPTLEFRNAGENGIDWVASAPAKAGRS